MWVYKITNKLNGKVYVGKTCYLQRRWRDHRRGKHVGAIARAFKKYGADAFEFAVIASDIASEDEMNRLEIEWIAKLESHGSLKGYNMTLGGDGTRFSEEMRLARSGPNAWMYGKKHTEEARRKMSAQRKGTPLTEAQLAWRKGRLKGRPKSAEHRAKIGAAHRGKKASAEVREKLRKPKSEAHKASMRKAFLARPAARFIEFRGERLNLSVWASRYGLSTQVIQHRLKSGWPVDEALKTPAGRARPPAYQLSLNI